MGLFLFGVGLIPTEILPQRKQRSQLPGSVTNLRTNVHCEPWLFTWLQALWFMKLPDNGPMREP